MTFLQNLDRKQLIFQAEAPKKPVGRGSVCFQGLAVAGARSRSRSGQRKELRTSSADLWEAPPKALQGFSLALRRPKRSGRR